MENRRTARGQEPTKTGESGASRQPAEKLCMTDMQRDHLRFLGKKDFSAREKVTRVGTAEPYHVCVWNSWRTNTHKQCKKKKKKPPSKELSMTQTMESATTFISRAFLGSKPRAFSEVSWGFHTNRVASWLCPVGGCHPARHYGLVTNPQIKKGQSWRALLSGGFVVPAALSLSGQNVPWPFHSLRP